MSDRVLIKVYQEFGATVLNAQNVKYGFELLTLTCRAGVWCNETKGLVQQISVKEAGELLKRLNSKFCVRYDVKRPRYRKAVANV